MPIHRGIIVVHGVGEAKPGEFIDKVVEPIANYLGDALGHERVHVVGRGDSPDDSWVRIDLKDHAGRVEECWDFRETWWAKTFRPSRRLDIFGWFLLVVFGTYGSFWSSVLRGPGKVGRPSSNDQGVWLTTPRSWLDHIFDFVGVVVASIGYMVAVTACFLLLLPFYLLVLLPLATFIPGPASSVLRRIENMIVSNFGDQYAMTTRRIAVADAANEVSQNLYQMLDTRALRGRREAIHRRGHGPFEGYRTITLITHSGGAVVALRALNNDETRRWIQQNKGANAEFKGSPERLNWITLGSGLNVAWKLHRDKDHQDSAFFKPPLHDIANWIDICARYDAVAQGSPPKGLVEALVGPAQAGPRPYVQVPVINSDVPFRDHFEYWHNQRGVVARFVHVIMSNGLAKEHISPEKGSVFGVDSPPAAGTAARKIYDRVADDTTRCELKDQASATFWRRTIWFDLATIALLAVGIGWAGRFGRWLAGGDSWLGLTRVVEWLRDRLAEGLPQRMAANGAAQDFGYWLLGVGAILLPVLLASALGGIVSRVFGWLTSKTLGRGTIALGGQVMMGIAITGGLAYLAFSLN